MKTKTQNVLCHQDTKTQRNYIKKTWCLGAFVVKRRGITLPEMTVVIAIVALMVALTIPAANMLFNSFESQSGAKSIISAALSSARAIAAQNQRYAGIRFQKRYDPTGPLKAPQYMVFIIHDAGIPPGVQGNLGCRTVDGIEPIKLPDTIGMMEVISGDSDIDNDNKFTNKTTFSILFSPSGKLVTHNLWIRNRNGVNDNSSNDDVFNSLTNVRDNKIGMFPQDVSDSPDLPIESSKSSFYIYETKKLNQTATNLRWTNYLNRLKPIYINPYTGTIIEQ